MLALTLAEVLPEADEGPPPPWDARGEYRCSNVEVYFQVCYVCPFGLWQTLSGAWCLLCGCGCGFSQNTNKDPIAPRISSLQATKDASAAGAFASEGAYVTGVEKIYALTGVGEDDYEGGELSREAIEAELARRNVWRDGGEVGLWFGWWVWWGLND